MASNLGNTPISTTMRREGTRAIWYSRYIDWTITTPLLLLTLLLATGLPLGDITTIIACKSRYRLFRFRFLSILCVLVVNIFMFVCLLIGALIESDYKWGFYVLALAALFYVAYHLMAPARGSARLLGLDWGRTYTRSAGLLVFVWALYVSRFLSSFTFFTHTLLVLACLLGFE